MGVVDELLARLERTGDNPVVAVDWTVLPPELPEVPADYRTLVDALGPGCLDGFLWVLAPGHPNPNLDLLRQLGFTRWSLDELVASGEEVPYVAHPEPGGLVPVARTDNGDTVYWVTAGEPDEWAIVVNESRAPGWHPFPGGFAAWLLALIDRRDVVEFFPEEFPETARYVPG